MKILITLYHLKKNFAMAMSDGCTVVNKQSLKNTSMHAYHIKRNLQTTSMCLDIAIDEFPELKDDVIYLKPLSYKSWIMTVLKKKETTILTLQNCTGCRYGIKCYIWYDGNSRSQAVLAEEKEANEYIIKLFPEDINKSQNKCLKYGFLFLQLEIVFRFTDGIIRLVTETKFINMGKSILGRKENKMEIENSLLEDMDISMLYNLEFSDFRIKVKDYSVTVNKSVIAARSKYFFDYLQENPDSKGIEIDTSREVLTIILTYMYCGVIYVETASTMLKVVILAYKLQMKNFCQLCVNILKQSVYENNV